MNNLAYEAIIKTELFNNLRAVVETEIIGSGYMLCYIHPEDQEQSKEGYYQHEQSPFFGSYINNRQKFDLDWAAGDYESTYCIRLNREDIQIIGQIGSTWTRREEPEGDYIENIIE